MVRRFPSQVPQQVSRLLRSNYISKQPVWFQSVLDYPPLPLPPKAPPPRSPYDQTPSLFTTHHKLRKQPTRPLKIHYIEDDVRRQFFRDHPFEAFRPATLVEEGAIEDPNPVQGSSWTRLKQRGQNPSPEDTIHFALNLYQHHAIPLTQAYAQAVAQFRALRSEHHIATTFAVIEAEHLGATFLNSEIAHAFEKEKKVLATWERSEELDEGALAARKRWKAIVDKDPAQWTKGQHYVRLWREGIKPDYSPALTQPVEGIPIENTLDYMGIQTQR